MELASTILELWFSKFNVGFILHSIKTDPYTRILEFLATGLCWGGDLTFLASSQALGTPFYKPLSSSL